VGSPFQRARQPEQKEERRSHVLATTRAMIEGGVELGAVSLNQIARRAGMAKSNVYRYFETREAVLLALLWEELELWVEAMRETWPSPSRGRSALETLVRHLARTLADRPMLCALITAVPSVLEHNLGEETIRAFKLRALQWFREGGRLLALRAPELTAKQYAELLYDATAVIGGLYPAAYPTEVAARVGAEPALKPLRRDLRRDLERFLLALARDRARSDG
jgi:AcrR family transcriptional regulator